MSFFGVTLETIATINKHPNADRLEIATLVGMDFQFVVGKNEWKVGDRCFYFPIDSLIPEEVQKKLGLHGKLHGPLKNRLKTVKLRGQISQGVIGALNLITDKEVLNNVNSVKDKYAKSKIITNHFNVDKYNDYCDDSEDLGYKSKFKNLFNKLYYKWIKKLGVKRNPGLPIGQSMYDIESVDRNKNVVDMLFDKDVVISEKMEGQNISVTIWKSTFKNNISVNSRTRAIYDKKYYVYKDARDCKLINFAEYVFKKRKIFSKLCDMDKKFGTPNGVIVYGELCGPKIQNNIYKLDKYNIYVFDIVFLYGKNNKYKVYLQYSMFSEILNEYKNYITVCQNLLSVPILWKGKLHNWLMVTKSTNNNENWTIKLSADGKSMLSTKDVSIQREGIVIRPAIEEYCQELNGRLILKQRGINYLLSN